MPQSVTLLKEEPLAQVFSCEFCEIFNNTYFEEHLQMAASCKRRILSFFVAMVLMTLPKKSLLKMFDSVLNTSLQYLP